MKIINHKIFNSLMTKRVIYSICFVAFTTTCYSQSFSERPKGGELGIVKVFPNPLNEYDVVTVEFETAITGTLTYSLIDQIGNPYIRNEQKLDHHLNKISIDFTPLNLKPGIYFLRLKNEMKPEKVLKIIKK